MAELLKEHWSATFSNKDVDFKDIDSWWKEDGYSFTKDGPNPSLQDPAPPPIPNHTWALTVEHVEKAIRYSNDSSPGPDGIPYTAWRVLIKTSKHIIFDVSREIELEGPSSPLPDDFNWSFLCCLPLKPAGDTEQ
eukprot:10477280-Heterocapsa_arctica.AAC.1